MNLFSEYLEPLISWLHTNPDWALLITFLISLSESVAIIGSIVPGSITMTAIGILAGSGVMRIDLTLVAAILGAIAGDSVSYALGYTFSDRLMEIWPFSRYPKLLELGKNYFTRHGGKSVLIGRFVGPLRSIIPLIAGMMRMKRSHFLVANSLSAVGWSLLYVMPGVLIGAASHQLSPESARRLFMFILIFLVVLWLAGQGLRWVILYIKQWLSINISKFWIWARNKHYLALFLKKVSPIKERNKSKTIALLLALVICGLLSFILSLLVLNNSWVNQINLPIYYFLKSVRIHCFDNFFILWQFILSPGTQSIVFIVSALLMIYIKDWRTLKYWISLSIVTFAITFLLSQIIYQPSFLNLFTKSNLACFPSIYLTSATALFSFLIAYISVNVSTKYILFLKLSLWLILLTSGFATLYLGDAWLTSVLGAYFIGLTCYLIHWIFYRRKVMDERPFRLSICLLTLIVIVSTLIQFLLYFETEIIRHKHITKQYMISEEAWWNQREPVLPVYAKNRIGKRVGLYNIQYAGSLTTLENKLLINGWKKQPGTFFHSLILRVEGKNNHEKLPLISQLFLNKRPALIMTYHPQSENGFYVLRLWRSNYHLVQFEEPIWIGSVTYSSQLGYKNHDTELPVFAYLLNAVLSFQHRSITLSVAHKLSLPKFVPEVLIIKER